MLPASRSGNTSTLACPATLESGALEAPISGTIAASNCSSPSNANSGAISLANLVASTTLSTSACFALPLEEWDSIATFGSCPTNILKLSAEETAIAANSSGVGFWFRPQSANTNVPLSPRSQSGTSIKKNAETNLVPGLVLITCKQGLKVFAVEWQAPDTIPSASPFLIIKQP